MLTNLKYNYFDISSGTQMSLVLQKIAFPIAKQHAVKDLYFHLIHGDYEFRNDALILQRDSRISFNSYFNVFYEAYWKKYTILQNLTLRLQVEGQGKVCILRDSAIAGCYELESISFNTYEPQILEIDVQINDIFSDKGRLFIDILSRKRNVVVRNIEWITKEETNKRLTVGLCTFNKEAFLYKNILGLLNLAKELPYLKKIIIVNQGNEFEKTELIDLLENNRHLFDVYKQDNLGGAGGFTRTLYEASSKDLSDLHLLMDDDILLDPNVIRTAFNFAALAKNTIAVGGQMLDLLRPNIMHEYGGKVDYKGYISPLFHNLNVGDFLQLSHFNKVTEIDYNAWWFCMLPTKSIRELNLPAPIFIRGDDQEYGIRLKQNSIETVGLPGVGLWHEPFYAKVGGWQTYYDYRNRMILASSYDHLQNEEVESLFTGIEHRLLCHDYQSVKLILQAIKDFARGIDLFQEGSQDIHMRITKLAKDYAPKSLELDHYQYHPLQDHQIPPHWNDKDRKKNWKKQAFLLSLFDFSKKEVKHLWDRYCYPQNIDCHPYVQSNGILSYFYLYEPNKAVFKELSKEIKEARNIYMAAVENNNWKSISELKKKEYWDNIFYVSE